MNAPSPLRTTAAATLLALAGCAGLGDTVEPPLIDDGDRLMEFGDFDRAVSAYRRDLATDPDDVRVREKLAIARSRAATHFTDLAILASTGGDVAEAERMMRYAQEMDPELPHVQATARHLRPMIEGAARAGELKALAKGAMKTNPIRAEEWLVEARTLNPNDPESINLLAEATMRAEGQRAYLRASELWKEHRRAEAIAALRHARYDNEPVRAARGLWKKIEKSLVDEAATANEAEARLLWQLGLMADLSRSAVRTLRAALVDRLSERAAELRAAGRPAVAALVEIEARRVGGRIRTPALDEARQGAAIDLVVAPFGIETEGAPSGDAAGRAVRRRIEEDLGAGGALLRVSDGRASTEPGPHDVRLVGAIRTVRVAENAPTRTTKSVSYRSGSRPETAEETGKRSDGLGKLRVAIVAALAEQKEAREALEKLLASHERRLNNLRFDAYSKRRLNQAAARARAADELVRRLRAQGEKLLDEETGLPRKAMVPVFSDHEVVVTKRTKRAVLGGEIALVRGGEEVLRKTLTASVLHEETTAPAFAPAELPEDADDMPDDAGMTERALERFAELVSAEVRHAAEALGRGFLEAARKDEAAGRVDRAAEGYALYLLATPELNTDARAEAAKAVRELAQVHVAVRTGAGNEPR